MAMELLPDELWNLVLPLLPVRPPRPSGGRPPADDRKCLTAGFHPALRTPPISLRDGVQDNLSNK